MKKAILIKDENGPTYTLIAPFRIWPLDVWQSVISEGVFSHLPQKSRARLGASYAQIYFMQETAIEAERLRWRLRGLGYLNEVDPSTKARLIEEIEEERGRYEVMSAISKQLIKSFDDLKIDVEKNKLDGFLSKSKTLKFCRAQNLPMGSLDQQK